MFFPAVELRNTLTLLTNRLRDVAWRWAAPAIRLGTVDVDNIYRLPGKQVPKGASSTRED